MILVFCLVYYFQNLKTDTKRQMYNPLYSTLRCMGGGGGGEGGILTFQIDPKYKFCYKMTFHFHYKPRTLNPPFMIDLEFFVAYKEVKNCLMSK